MALQVRRGQQEGGRFGRTWGEGRLGLKKGSSLGKGTGTRRSPGSRNWDRMGGRESGFDGGGKTGEGEEASSAAEIGAYRVNWVLKYRELKAYPKVEATDHCSEKSNFVLTTIKEILCHT